jgi:hypothetical protein
MVRFEKLLWESLVNTKMFGRERVIAKPAKWFNASRNKENKVAAHYYFTQGLRATLFKSVENVLAWMFWKWPRDFALQRGLAMEDFIVHSERELRRDYMFEQIIRQGCHPYQHLFYKRRRARFYKVERAVRGFFVPDYLRKEAENVLLADTLAVKEEWDEYVYTNWISDLTPATRYTAMHRLIPLEIFNVYGLLRSEAWDRYFYNEMIYDQYTAEDYKIAETPFGAYNLDRDDGKRAFEAEVNKFIQMYPGTIVRQGESFNFKEFYARQALLTGKDVAKLDANQIEELRIKLTGPNEVSSLNLPAEKVGKSILGTSFPAAFQSIHRKVMM